MNFLKGAKLKHLLTTINYLSVSIRISCIFGACEVSKRHLTHLPAEKITAGKSFPQQMSICGFHSKSDSAWSITRQNKSKFGKLGHLCKIPMTWLNHDQGLIQATR